MKDKLFVLRRVLSIAMALVFTAATLGNGCAYSVAADKNELALNTAVNTSESFKKNSTVAGIAHTKLMNSFYASKENRRISDFGSYTVDSIYANGFPDYYAGAYINPAGKLVVLTTASLSSAERADSRSTIEALAESTDIVFGSAKYSYKELITTMSQIFDYCQANGGRDARKFYITGYGIDDYNNRVVVYMNSIDDAARSWFYENVTAADHIEFVEKASYDTTTANCGEKISKSSAMTGEFSIGFRAKYTNSSGGSPVYGFVTCGHSFIGATTSIAVFHESTQIGSLVASKNEFQNGGCIDAAFIRTGNANDMSPSVVTRNGGTYAISTSTLVTPAVGQTVYMYGANTDDVYGYRRQGTVQCRSFTSNIEEPELQLIDMIKASYESNRGDSGGIVFADYGVGQYAVCGVQSSKGTGDEVYSVFSKAMNITTGLGVSLY